MYSNRSPRALPAVVPVPASLDWLTSPDAIAFGFVGVLPLVGILVLLGTLRESDEERAPTPVENCPACGTPVGEERLYCGDCAMSASRRK